MTTEKINGYMKFFKKYQALVETTYRSTRDERYNDLYVMFDDLLEISELAKAQLFQNETRRKAVSYEE